MRIVKLKNAKLKDILEKRQLIVDEAKELNTKKEAIEKEMAKRGYEMNKLKDKTAEVLKKEAIEMGEFEDISEVRLEKGEVVIGIFDHIEEYKQVIRKQKAEKK